MASQSQEIPNSVLSRLTGLSNVGRYPRFLPDPSSKQVKKLCERQYTSIMASFYDPNDHASDLLTSAYKFEWNGSHADQIAASSLLVSLQGGVAQNIAKWIDEYNTRFARLTNRKHVHDHATRTFFEVADEPQIEVKFLIDQELQDAGDRSDKDSEYRTRHIRVTITFDGDAGSKGGCKDCYPGNNISNSEEDDDNDSQAYTFDVSLDVKKDILGRGGWSVSSDLANALLRAV